MNFTFNNSSIVSVNSGTIVLNVSGKTRTFVDAKLISAVGGEIVLDLPEASFKKGSYIMGVSNDGGKAIFILSKHTDIRTYYHVSTCYSTLRYDDYWLKHNSNFRNATPEEIQELNDQLAAVGKCWNPDTMQIEKLKWKPTENTKYFHILIAGGTALVDHYLWKNDEVDRNYYELGNCFKTKEEAKAKLEEIKKILA